MSLTILVKHVSLALFALFLLCSCSQKVVLTLGTGNTGGNYDKTGLAIARAVAKQQEAHGIRLEVKTSAGSVANIDAIMAGDMAFGIAQADRQYQAVHGLVEWERKGRQKDLRSVLGLYTESVTLIAGRDAGIDTVNDLKGKRVDIGQPGSGIRQNAVDALAVAGIDWQKDLRASQDNGDVRIRSLMDSKIDALFHTVGHPSSELVFLTMSMRRVRFVPLVNIESLLAKNPYYSKSIIPVKEFYPRADNDKDVGTVGVKAVLLTSAKVPDDVVYAVTKAVFDDLAGLKQDTPILMNLSKEHMLEGLTAPIHPGALRYYKEIGLQVPPT